MPPDVFAVFGPTGVGKTEIAVELADLLTADGRRPTAISADAIAVYEGLDVLAAKPTPEQQDRLEHRLLSCVPIDEEFSAGRFAELAHAEIDGLLDSGGTPIVVGGTGLYLRAALTELDLRPPPDRNMRAQLEQELAEAGPAALHGRLSAATAATVHPSDRKRIVRALELETMGTQPHSGSDQLWSDDLRRPSELFGIVMDREEIASGSARASRRCWRAGRSRRSSGRSSLVCRARRARRSASRRSRHTWPETRRSTRPGSGSSEATSPTRSASSTWMRKLAGVEVVDRTGVGAAELAARLLAAAETD